MSAKNDKNRDEILLMVAKINLITTVVNLIKTIVQAIMGISG